jgi:ATP-dependent helicase/nuclease subunit A
MTPAKPSADTPQIEASDPRRSVWVSANAGSGKTTVLVQRVIRLLLDGVAPSRILCLTYTKAAAAHMANEILKKLGAWVRLDDAALDAALAGVDPRAPDERRRALARRLFSAALETPGGLKVQTIHAFCDRVLHMFPVEGEAPAGFSVIDEYTERDLIERARIEVMLEAGLHPDRPLGQAFSHCLAICGDDGIRETLAEAVRERHLLQAIGFDEIAAALPRGLRLDPGDTLQSLTVKILESTHLPRAEWRNVLSALSGFGGNIEDVVEKLSAACAAGPDEVLDVYLSIFLTEKGTVRAGEFGNKEVRAKAGDICARLAAERDRIAGLIGKLRAARERERSLALLTLAKAVIERYEAAKRMRGALDFADLVGKTVALLEREASAWVHFKLDGGIEHILVDEAQDTSPEQWRIIGKLAEEFFAGKGVSERTRTIFAVGDEKQSIFSFQGADPKRFDEMRRHFKRLIAGGGGAMREPRLLHSFRSAPVVLNAVDLVFRQESARRGLTANDPAAPLHEAMRQAAPGTVEIWPLVQAGQDSDDEDGWQAPLDSIPEHAAETILAQRIAQSVRHWTSGGLSVAKKKNFAGAEERRAAEAGDIVILVQRRGKLFESILRALKQANIPVAGADRLVLTDHIAVMDLMALGDALLLDRDDLALASVLKSPLFGMDDADLYRLAHGRSGTLAQSLASDPHYAAAAGTLSRWREEARHLRPFDFYSRVLGRGEGRKRMIARLGLEAADAIDEFLTQALAYEQTETPSLQGFLGALRRTGAVVKRDLETESHAVRVMTTHGVKGLEAPIVLLADTTAKPFERHHPKLMPVHEGPDEKIAALIWALGKTEDSDALKNAREHARGQRDREYRRLLYVALTRAADVLVVAGALNKTQKEAPEGSWYALVERAFKNESEPDQLTEHPSAYGEGTVSRWRAEAAEPAAKMATAPKTQTPLPAWLGESPKPAAPPRRKLRPSFSQMPILRERGIEGGKRRGVLLHRLLQSLPDVSQGERHAAALRYLSQAAPDFPEDMRESLAAEALGVIDHEDCAALFAPGSRAEPELIAHLGEGADAVEIAARIDRLHVSAETIVFGDFKSDTRVPETPGQIPAPYLAQLAAYRAALLQAFPGRAARALLIYTAGPRVFEIPAESLESAWQRLKTQTSPAFGLGSS